MKDLINLARRINSELPVAFWEWNADDTHFWSECGNDTLYNRDGKEVCSNFCPKCGCFMTHQEDRW